jgi:hypothetical protein
MSSLPFRSEIALRTALLLGLTFALGMSLPSAPYAQTTTTDDAAQATGDDSDTDGPLSEDELQVLVARIALYPDDLVALVTSASIYPLQIVEAERYLEKKRKDKSLKPKTTWDGSVISLLNYPDIVKMMSEDLEWTQDLDDALAAQQKYVLVAIQQLRDEAVAKGIIKTDDKIKVVQQDNDVIIQPVNSEKVYVPRYEPEMLYTSDYAPAPIAYYPDPYPNYYYPNAPYFAAAVTGVVWAAAVNWGDYGVWGGRWNNDVDIDCNKCFNNINGRVGMNDVDWRNVDRSKMNFDRNQFNNINRNDFNKSLRTNNNSFDKRVNNARKSGNTNIGNNRSGNRVSANDVRAAKNSGNRVQVNNNVKVDKSRNDNRKVNNKQTANRKNVSNKNSKVNQARKSSNINNVKKRSDVKRNSNVNRQARKAKPGGRVDNRGRQPSALGEVRSGRTAQRQSNRGRASMSHNRGGGMRMSRGGGGRRR